MQSQRQSLLAHVLPMAAFLVLLAIGEWMPASSDAFVLRHAEFWIYPAQAILGGVLLVGFRRCYYFAPLREPAFTLLVAAAVFLIWTWPHRFFGASPRTGGFNPTLLIGHPVLYWLSVALRFLRLVVVVPLVEEIFWRAFLLRIFIYEQFERVPFGSFTWLSFSIVTLAFAFSHTRPDWPAALCAGALYNLVAYRTRSLTSCVLAHAATNLLLGIWIMHSRQWGFW